MRCRRSCFGAALAVLALASGCSVKATFPSDKAGASIQSICRDVYKMETLGAANGKSIGALYYTDTILDETGKQISKEAHEKIGNLTQAVTRVGLSTDREVDFVVVAVRGQKEQMELRIVRSMEDIRKAQAEALSIPESMNRTLFVQSRYTPAKEGEEAGFELQDLKMEEFLILQILQRVRFGAFSNDKEKNETQDPAAPQVPTEYFDGRPVETDGQRVMEFTLLTLKEEKSDENLRHLLRAIRSVLSGYDYKDFDRVMIRDLLRGKKMVFGKSTFELFNRGKLSEDDLLNRNYVEDAATSKIFKNALEVINSSQPQ